jgi:hypothetical protein
VKRIGTTQSNRRSALPVDRLRFSVDDGTLGSCPDPTLSVALATASTVGSMDADNGPDPAFWAIQRQRHRE